MDETEIEEEDDDVFKNYNEVNIQNIILLIILNFY